GGPGTGKTTVIKGIIQSFSTIHDLSTDPKDYKNAKDFPFILTAPTGRAAKRLQESTGIKASTIDSLLGCDGNEQFDKIAYEHLLERYLFINYYSMFDNMLYYLLF